MVARKFFQIASGQRVESDGRQFVITHILSGNAVIGVDEETKETLRLKIESIHPVKEKIEENAGSQRQKDLVEFTDEDWEIARARLSAINPLLQCDNPTRSVAENVAKRAGVGVATIYRWRDRYLSEGHLLALVPARRGRRKGTTGLDDAQEAVINSVIEDAFLNKQRKKAQDIIEEVLCQCRVAGIDAPHPNTVRSRINKLSPREVLRRRGFKDRARDLYEPIEGEFPGADTPLAVVQIDHTEADVILVEETTRLPICRPWITLAIDVCTRVVCGIYVGLEPPSAISVGMCISSAMLPKGEYLAELDVPGEWPVWGKMGVIHVDNAKEFRGLMLQQSCEDYGIDLQLRPVKTPHYGGHIERLMGTVGNEIRKLPGATFSSPKQREGYDSSKESALTLREFEQHLVDFIVNKYHRRIHTEIGLPPMRKWDVGILGDGHQVGIGLPELPSDPYKLRLDFMPVIKRTVQPYGLLLDHIYYYSEVLNPWINAPDESVKSTKRKFIVRRDPRDISRVYFFDPVAGQYFVIPYRNSGHPPMSVWELREVLSKLKEEGRQHVDEEAIFETLRRLNARIDEAKAKTKTARRKLARSPRSIEAQGKMRLSGRAEPPPRPQRTQIEDDIFSTPPQTFDIQLEK